MERSGAEFSNQVILAGGPCWQIDNDNLEPPFNDGEWESELARALVDLAEAHEISELLCSTSTGPSVEFGHHGYSVWIACVGSPPMVKACRDLIEEIIPPHSLRKERVARSQHWVERIRLADGRVWVPDDAATWRSVDVGPQSIEDLEEEPEPLSPGRNSDFDQDEETASIVPSTSKSGRTRRTHAAHSDVKVSYYQKKIEKMFGLPEGSVKFVNPDGSVSKANQLVGNLRARWEE